MYNIIQSHNQLAQQVARPNRNNPLGRKLLWAVNGDNPSMEICGNTPLTNSYGTKGMTARGKVFIPGTGESKWVKANTALDPKVGGSFTIGWIGYIKTNVQNILFGSKDSTFGWYFYLSAYAPGYSNINLYSINTASLRGGLFPSFTNDDTRHSFIGRYDAVNNTGELFMDGASLALGSWTRDGTAMNSGQYQVMTGDATKPQWMRTCQVFKGMLSNKEIQSWLANPGQVFATDHQLLFPVAGGGPSGGTYVKVAGAWVPASSYTKVAGVWQPNTRFIKNAGTWKPT